jgi:hypothetical protein
MMEAKVLLDGLAGLIDQQNAELDKEKLELRDTQTRIDMRRNYIDDLNKFRREIEDRLQKEAEEAEKKSQTDK